MYVSQRTYGGGPVMSTLAAETQTDPVATLLNDLRKLKATEAWELEVGDPFYVDEPIACRPKPGVDNAPRRHFVDAYDEHGEPISYDWAQEKPRGKRASIIHQFLRTPNHVLLGKTGLILVSRGEYGLIPDDEGGRYVPIDEWRTWDNERVANDPRTLARRPAWATGIQWWGKSLGGSLDYVHSDNGIDYKQRLAADDTMSPAWGSLQGRFETPDELRQFAARCLAFADTIEGQAHA